MTKPDKFDEYAAVADLYDDVLPYRDRSDVAFFVEEARDSGGPVLELGCGTGRVLIPTALAGIDIAGLDASPGMLAVCRGRVGGSSVAAAKLGVPPSTLDHRIKALNINKAQFKFR